MAVPTPGVPYVSDPFNRADGDLSSAGWSAMFAGSPLQIISELLWGGNEPSGSLFTGTAFPNDQWAQCLIGTTSSSSDDTGFGVVVRGATSGSGYVALVNTNNKVSVGKYVTGTYTSLSVISTTVGNGDVLRLEVQGTTLRVFVNNVQVGTDITDAALSSGSPGLARKGSSGNNVDDFHAGDFNGPFAISVTQVDASGAQSGSGPVTVPADAEGVVLLWCQYDGNSNSVLATATLGGASILAGVGGQQGDGAQSSDTTGIGVFALAPLPGTGSQTFAWAWSGTGGARSEGGAIFLVWIKGIDTADYARDFDVDSQVGGNAPQLTLDGIPTDLTVILYQKFNVLPDGPMPAYILASATVNSEGYIVAANGANHIGNEGEAPSPLGADSDYSSMAAITIKRGTATSEPIAASEIFEWPGAFFFDISPSPLSDLSNRLDALAEAGFKWCAAQAFDDTALIEQAAMGAFRDGVRARGMYFGIWGVHHDDPSGDATRASSQIDLWGADFYIANAEIEYKVDGPGTRAHSATFVNAFRALQPDIAAALSTYGAIANEIGVLGDITDVNGGVMDLKSWYDAGFHVMPQAYASDAVYVPDRVIRHFRRCRWPFSGIHPTLGIFIGGATYDGADYRTMIVDETNSEYEYEVRADSPRALYKMQDASGAPVDMSPNGLNMTTVTGTPDYAQPGPFPGSSSIRLAGGEAVSRSSVVSTVVNDFTIEMLVHVQAIGLNDMILIYNGNSGANGWGITVNVDRRWRFLAGGVAQGSFAANPLPDNFAHLAVVRRAGTWEYYLQGALDTANAGTNAPGTPSGTTSLGDSAVQEAVAFAAIYETALSPTRILEHAKAFGKNPPVCSRDTAYGFNLFLAEEWGVLGIVTEQDVIELGQAASLDKCARRPQDLIVPIREGSVVVRI